jgi:hypothetical protein
MSRSRRPAVFIVVFAFGIGLASPADAKCEYPEPILAPDSGVVPPNPVLTMLVPAGEPRGASRPTLPPPTLVALSNGVAVPVTVRADSQSPALDAYRIEVRGAGPGRLVIQLFDTPRDAQQAAYSRAGTLSKSWSLDVDAAWRRPAGSSAPIVASRTDTLWQCSHQTTRDLRFAGSAAAYRVVAADSPADFATGKTRQAVLPHDPEQIWSPAKPGSADLALGYVDCFGESFAWGKGPAWIKVLALLPDGSEQAVNGAPIQVMPP